MRTPLLRIYEDIERRTRATSQEHTWWPCRRGCDACCRSLADVPRLTRAEWELLHEGIAALPSEVRAEVERKIASLTTARPIVCPMLDEAEGACRVYAHRPAACRTYGYYVERGIGLHCDQITQAANGKDDVLWGNQESVDAALSRGSGSAESKSLVE